VFTREQGSQILSPSHQQLAIGAHLRIKGNRQPATQFCQAGWQSSVRNAELGGMITGQGMFQKITTEWGDRFLPSLRPLFEQRNIDLVWRCDWVQLEGLFQSKMARKLRQINESLIGYELEDRAFLI
jgi:hypothetical protein